MLRQLSSDPPAAPRAPQSPRAATHNRLGQAALLALGLAAGSGCATTADAGHGSVLATDGVRGGPLTVQIEGLDFLTLGNPRTLVIPLMRGHGYECRDEAATAQLVACTHAGRPAAILTFLDDELDAVRTPLAATGGDPRDQFDELFNSGRRVYPQAYVQRTEDVHVAHFLPGDGSAIELRLFVGSDSIEKIHFAPEKKPKAEGKPLKLSKR